jgi:outer membrane protein OmpA-like peptidoglycan-associated protein
VRATSATAADGAYSTLPDGSPTPVVAIFDRDRISLVGAVPSEDAAEQLTELAIANSQFADVPVDNRLTVNPNVPVGLGLRVLELNSVRFAEESAEITPEHATQLDRLAAVMNATPNISVVVIGHADQRGSDTTNLALGQQRADAVVAYLTSLGIDGSRLSARSVGEADLLSTGDDEASLALNRRTEFVIQGLLVAPAPPPSTGAPTTTAG